MKQFKIFLAAVLLYSLTTSCGIAQEIYVCVNGRGNTGLEEEVKSTLTGEFNSFSMVKTTKEKDECHLYVDISMVEQQPIRFYAIGISIAYHLNGHFYSRPTSDVSQFGEERLQEVCLYLAGEIDKGFLEPLREHPE